MSLLAYKVKKISAGRLEQADFIQLLEFPSYCKLK